MGAAGIGLRAPHCAALLEQRPALGFLEVHSENFFAAGGAGPAMLERFRERYPLSFHGVGLSIGSVDPLDARHLDRLAALVDRFEPWLVSEHLSWSSVDGRFANELLPLPATGEAIDHVVARIDAVQERLGRRLLMENVSSYHAFEESTLPEWEFVAEIARRSGCAILLDLNNVWVNAVNHGFDAHRYLDAIPVKAVGQFHLAGHERTDRGLVDSHGAPVCEEVWSLYAHALARFGAVPTLVEWDVNLPPLEVLLAEAARADAAMRGEIARMEATA